MNNWIDAAINNTISEAMGCSKYLVIRWFWVIKNNSSRRAIVFVS